jgi:hypothetical protein
MFVLVVLVNNYSSKRHLLICPAALKYYAMLTISQSM